MARMDCRCGAYLSNTAVPNDVELTVFTDFEWVDFSETVYDKWDKMTITEKDRLMFEYPKRDVWYCKKCGRIYVFEQGNDIPKKVYALEKEA